MKKRKRIELGKHIVSDPEICGGDPTFIGTRVLVKDGLYYVGKGKDWDWIVAAYRDSISREGVAEAVQLAHDALVAQTEKQWRQAA